MDIPVRTPGELGATLSPGDIILTSFPSSGWLARAIRVGQSLADGEAALWGHAMRYVGLDESGEPQVVSQEWRVVLKPLAAWRGALLCRLHNPAYSQEQRETLVALALSARGRPYDVLGLLGQALRGLPLVGPWLARVVQVPWLTYCSEMVAEHERRVAPQFMADIAKPAPDDMAPWARAQGWQVEMCRLA
jgi:hypothetical protein